MAKGMFLVGRLLSNLESKNDDNGGDVDDLDDFFNDVDEATQEVSPQW